MGASVDRVLVCQEFGFAVLPILHWAIPQTLISRLLSRTITVLSPNSNAIWLVGDAPRYHVEFSES